MQLEKLTAVELGDKVNAKEISPVEVIDYFEKHVEQHNPALNAFVYTKFDEAKQEAKLLEKQILEGLDKLLPLAGVPVGLKDFLPAKKGWTASHGGVKSFITVDQEDGEVYKAFKKLGAIAVGKTNAPSFGFRGTTYNKMYGNTNNPFNTKYNSGGSSGGSCAAVGGLLVPLADAGDGGGSTRIPAAWCNCFGMKMSAGMVPSVCRPDAWTATHPYCGPGPVSRTVEDALLVISEMIKYDPRDPISVPRASAWDINKCRDLKFAKTLKVGFTLNFDLFPDPEPIISKTIMDAIEIFNTELTTKIEKATFQFNYDSKTMEDAWLRSISIDTAIDLELMKRFNGYDLLGEYSDDVCQEFIDWQRIAFSSTMLDYRDFHEIRTNMLDAHLDAFAPYDIIIAPVTGCMPVKNAINDGDTQGPTSISGISINPLIGFGYTYLENMTGFPAASVPIGISPEGLPIGLQVIGKRYHDEEILAFCNLVEKLMPWQHHYSERIQ